MFLKTLELFGFKSFADKTQLVIQPGITIVIGPNGCGKSNIVDSIRWVLGEKQARNIRGEKMEDIIFNGTDQRKPLSFAEVSLTVDNTNKILDIDSPAVTIARRIYRDGESEYLINKSTVRLKDIEQLFMDTGIGKTSYSVMEQGKIDLILSSRAEDRRYIFEEAAGISRFKVQKKESLKKLMDTNENIQRITDIIKEIEREKEIKARQSEKTREYLSLKNRLIQNDIILNYHKFNDTSKKREKLREEIQELNKRREDISVRISRLSADNEKDEKLKNDIQLKLFELDKELHSYKIKVEDIDGHTQKNRRMIDEQFNRRENLKKKIDEGLINIDRLNEEKKKTAETGIIIKNRLEEDRESLKNLQETRVKKTASINASRKKIVEYKAGIRSSEEALKELRGSLEITIKKLIDAIEKRKAELIGSEEERQSVRNKISEHLLKIQYSLKIAAELINSGKNTDAADALNRIDINLLKDDILKFESYEDGFRSILFDKTGIHAEKENIDGMIRDRVSSIENMKVEIDVLDEYIHTEQNDLEKIDTDIARTDKDISRNENEKEWIQKHLLSLGRQIEDLGGHLDNYRNEISASEKVADTLMNEINLWINSLVEFNVKSEKLQKSISEYTRKRSDIENHILKRKDTSAKEFENQNKIAERITAKEMSQVEFNFKINSIEEYLWTEYEKKITDLDKVPGSEQDIKDIQALIDDVKGKIQELGPINNLAIEEYKELQKRYDYYIDQRKDIEKAREDIIAVIEDINNTSVQMFMDTFQKIKTNFSAVFKQLFEGGDATVELADENNVLDCGIEIMARPPGKKLKYLNLLSGGERSLTAIALLYATYMVRPSPFCFLDEIDAALDEENVGRFIRMLQQFARNSQFIIITHNKKTMSIAESVYGITMEEPGVSKIISLRLDKDRARIEKALDRP
ncbi:MAG: AAA family ATPase [Spirochaetes bacterium]|nr:AAA family ATPase [Spirochaetota bacterium]